MQDLSTKYTVIKLENPEHQQKLLKYLQQYKNLRKTSYCRFYLRGLCIMKTQYCKFAHDFDELNLQDEDYKKLSLIQCAITQKEQRKKLFIQKTDFYQRPLFFIKRLDYIWLYQYQFTDRYKKSNNPPLTIQQINKNQPVRSRIRQIMHREQWDKLIAFIQKTFPEADYSISMFSNWFARLGYQKAQTFCKFGDFMRYLTYVRGYTELNIVVPPLLTRSIFYIKNKNTLMYELMDDLVVDSNLHRAQVKKMKQERMKKLPQNLQKKFICRFYMAGNCQKNREQCFYIHDIADIRYDKNQQFQKFCRQPPKSKEDRINYTSLYRFYQENKRSQNKDINIDDINANSLLKDTIRKEVHLRLYAEFLQKLSQEYQMELLPVYFIRNEYQKFGFNHTDQNKFGQLQGYFWDLGYYTIDLVNELKERHQYIAKVPSIQIMDKYFYHKILAILKDQLDQPIEIGQYTQILQSSIRRLIYSYSVQKDKPQIPLHVYLRKKNVTLKSVLQSFFPEYSSYIFFQSSQQNFKKLMEFIKKYFKRYKRFIYTLDQIDSYIRGLKKQEINMNSFVNYKSLLQLGLLQLNKQIYFWPFANATLVLDRSHAPTNQQKKQVILSENIPLSKQFIQKYAHLYNQKILVIDSAETFQYCSVILRSCFKYGIDLQGRLALGGYIDFVQISCINYKKFIFIIDIYKIKNFVPELQPLVNSQLKYILQDQKRLKIMHSCPQDVVALSYCMKINTKFIFDTSGTQIYLQQRAIYQQMHDKNHTYEHTLKKIHNIKTPGLNQMLQKWSAPNGPNQYKERMKKIFIQADREYFQKRPIVQQFLLYSARDVEDLIQTYQSMVCSDPQNMWVQIGKLYANFRQE